MINKEKAEYPCNSCGVEYCYQNCDKFWEWLEIAEECIQRCIDEENTSYSKYISPELVQDLSDFIDENYSDI